jgi:hypothetical protein
VGKLGTVHSNTIENGKLGLPSSAAWTSKKALLFRFHRTLTRMDDWYSMLDLVRSRSSGMRELIEKHGATTSHEIAGALLGVLNQVRREGPVPAPEANSAIFGLLRTLRVWEISPWTPEGMLNTLRNAIDEDGIPDDADRHALAELIARAAAQNEESCSRLELIHEGTVEICASLARRGELLPILALRPGTREFLTQRFEGMKRRFSTETSPFRGLYDDEIEFVLDVLRGDTDRYGTGNISPKL